jgi:hypothetical protein
MVMSGRAPTDGSYDENLIANVRGRLIVTEWVGPLE